MNASVRINTLVTARNPAPSLRPASETEATVSPLEPAYGPRRKSPAPIDSLAAHAAPAAHQGPPPVPRARTFSRRKTPSLPVRVLRMERRASRQLCRDAIASARLAPAAVAASRRPRQPLDDDDASDPPPPCPTRAGQHGLFTRPAGQAVATSCRLRLAAAASPCLLAPCYAARRRSARAATSPLPSNTSVPGTGRAPLSRSGMVSPDSSTGLVPAALRS